MLEHNQEVRRVRIPPVGFQFKINANIDPTIHGVLMEMSFGSYHVGGAQFAMADGSVRFISENVDLRLYQSLATRGNGEIVGDF